MGGHILEVMQWPPPVAYTSKAKTRMFLAATESDMWDQLQPCRQNSEDDGTDNPCLNVPIDWELLEHQRYGRKIILCLLSVSVPVSQAESRLWSVRGHGVSAQYSHHTLQSSRFKPGRAWEQTNHQYYSSRPSPQQQIVDLSQHCNTTPEFFKLPSIGYQTLAMSKRSSSPTPATTLKRELSAQNVGFVSAWTLACT